MLREYRYDSAEVRYIDGPTTRFGYRRVGSGDGVPLVLCMRFRGTIDDWDPAFLQVISDDHDVIVFDNAGVGYSSGAVPASVGDMADGVLEFVDALGLAGMDLLGWSLGGFVAQAVALKRPALIRRLVIAGSNPGKVPNTPPSPPEVWQIAPKPVNDDEDFLYLFFPDTPAARAAGIASLRRLDIRRGQSSAAVAAEGWKIQMQAIFAWAGGKDAAWDHLAELAMPVLVANGAHDVMTSAYNTYAMVSRLPAGTAVIYSDAGHGFLFQHPEAFGKQVVEFLR